MSDARPDNADAMERSEKEAKEKEKGGGIPPAKARIGVKSVQYPAFDENGQQIEQPIKENIDLIMDVPLQVSVELGRCRKSIKEVLGLKMGSVIVLDRMAGEMVDVAVNGKLFARGEVVVIDENYGVRITEVVSLNTKL
jgi:flagellar motor switch protein FliN/FliY